MKRKQKLFCQKVNTAGLVLVSRLVFEGINRGLVKPGIRTPDLPDVTELPNKPAVIEDKQNESIPHYGGRWAAQANERGTASVWLLAVAIEVALRMNSYASRQFGGAHCACKDQIIFIFSL